MDEVTVRPVPFARLAAILPGDRAGRLEQAAERARTTFGDRVVWHVNATASGGGVAEMLQTLLAYGKGAGIDNRWLVLEADARFFAITKRLHNVLHGEPGDGGPLGPAEHAHYDAVLRTNLVHLTDRISPGDLVLLHDPQTAGLTAGLSQRGAHVVWRCHIGRDTPNDLTDVGWRFLQSYLSTARALVFSRREYAPPWVEADRLVVIPPSIDPFAVKNMSLTPRLASAVLARVGLLADGRWEGPIDFSRRDGSPGRVRPRPGPRGLLQDGSVPGPEVPLVVQVSRWDRLKDMAGVMEGFVLAAGRSSLAGAHLVLAGPEVSGVSDDPEGAQVLAECQRLWEHLPDGARDRVHLASIPMDDADENALIINALQRQATVVVQKSLVEGFGLTVTEAMWKSRPVVASRLGGIQDQITDGLDGLLVEDPHDLDEFAAVLSRVIEEPGLTGRLGAAAHQRVLSEFLGDRHLGQYVELFSRLVSEPGGLRHDS